MIIIIVKLTNLLRFTCPQLLNNQLLNQKEFIMSMVISRYLNCRENRLPTLQSQHLFALTKEVRIEHEGEEYRLRLTRNNRLILTK
jgi:hemin uptake protein HemP